MIETGEVPKQSSDRWLFVRIVNAPDVDTLVDVGEDILELKMDRNHDRVSEAWQRQWKRHLESGQLEPARRFFYHRVLRSLRTERDALHAASKSRLERFHESVAAL
ncbi:MAG: hypothetical protein Q7R67_01405 [bacterium]|nr:hypothetical protein [bacterium]